MKGYNLLFLLLFCVNCSGKHQKQPDRKKAKVPKSIENGIMKKNDTLESYFVDVISKSIKSQGERTDFDYLTYRYPSETDPCYRIKVWKSTPNRFEAEFNFVSDAQTKEVKYLNVYTGDSIPLQSTKWYRK
jgi:hypothetical protein